MASSKAYLGFYFRAVIRIRRYKLLRNDGRIYYRGKIIGGIYDDRLLVKVVPPAIAYMSKASYELPYKGANEMVLVKEVDDRAFLTGLFHAMYNELPPPKLRTKR